MRDGFSLSPVCVGVGVGDWEGGGCGPEEGFGSGCVITMATELTAAVEGRVSSPCWDGTEAQTLGVLSECAQAAWQVSPEPD